MLMVINRKKLLIMAVALVLEGLMISLFPARGVTKNLVREVMKAYYVKEQMEVVSPLVDLYLAEFRAGFKPGDFTVIREVIGECYSADILYPLLVDYLDRSAEREYLQTLLEAAQTPLVSRGTNLVSAAGDDNAMADMIRFSQRLHFTPPSPARLELFERFSQATEAGEYAVTIPLACFRSVAFAVNSVLPSDERHDREELMRIIAAKKAELKRTASSNILLSFLFTYRSFSDENLSEYVEFLNTRESRWLNKMTNVALIRALGTITRAARHRVTELIARKKVVPGQDTDLTDKRSLKEFSRYGFSFTYPAGYFLKEIGLLEQHPNDASGEIKGGKDNKQGLTFNMFSIAWIKTVRFDLEAALNKGLKETLKTPLARNYQAGRVMDTEKAGHRLLYQSFSVTSSKGERFSGIVGTFHCTRRDKAFIIMSGGISGQVIRKDFNRLVDSMLCH